MGWGGWSKRVRIVVVAAVAIVVLGGGGTAVALKVSADRAEDRRQEQIAHEAEQRRAAAAEREREQAEADEQYEREVRTYRTNLVRELRKSVTAYARKLVKDGYLSGPIFSTSCENSDGKETDLEAENGAYECLTVHTKHKNGEVQGYAFKGRVNYEDGSHTWRYDP